MGIFALTLGSLFSELILPPFQTLIDGLDALATSRFSHPLSLKTGDELERISEGIVTLLEEMKEVAKGGKVLQQLLPKDPVKVGPVTAIGWARSPTQIGSEMFDLFPVGDHELGLLMMSVPERSIGAALLLAGAKAHTRLEFSSGRVDLPNILASVDREILAGNTSSAAINLLLGHLDVATGCLRLAWLGSFGQLLAADRLTLTRLKSPSQAGSASEKHFHDPGAHHGPTDTPDPAVTPTGPTGRTMQASPDSIAEHVKSVMATINHAGGPLSILRML